MATKDLAKVISVIGGIKISSPNEEFELKNSDAHKLGAGIEEKELRNSDEMTEQQINKFEAFAARPVITGLPKLTQHFPLNEDNKRRDSYTHYPSAKLSTLRKDLTTGRAPSDDEYKYVFADVFLPSDYVPEKSNINSEPKISLTMKVASAEDSRKLAQKIPKLEILSTASTADKVSTFTLPENKTMAPTFPLLLFDNKELIPYHLMSGTLPSVYSQSFMKGHNRHMVYPYRLLKIKPKDSALDAYTQEDILEERQNQIWSPGHHVGKQQLGNIVLGTNVLTSALPLVKLVQEPVRAVKFNLPITDAETDKSSPKVIPDGIIHIYPTLRQEHDDAGPGLGDVYLATRSGSAFVPEYSRQHKKSTNYGTSFAQTFLDKFLIGSQPPRERDSDKSEAYFYPGVDTYKTPHAYFDEFGSRAAEFPVSIRIPASQAEVESGKDTNKKWKDSGWIATVVRKSPGHKPKSDLQIPSTQLDDKAAEEASMNHLATDHSLGENISDESQEEPELRYIGGDLTQISKENVINDIAVDSKMKVTLPSNGTIVISANKTERNPKPVSEHFSNVSNFSQQTLLTHFNNEVTYSNPNPIVPNLKLHEDLGTEVHAMQDPAANILTPLLQPTAHKLTSQIVHIIPQTKESEGKFQQRTKEPDWKFKSYLDSPGNLDTEWKSEFGAPFLQIVTSNRDTSSLPVRVQNEDHVIFSEPKLSDWFPIQSDMYGNAALVEAHNSDEFPVVKQTELLSSESKQQSVNKEHKTIREKLNGVLQATNGKSDALTYENSEWREMLATPRPEEWPNVSQKPLHVVQISTELPLDVSMHSAQTEIPALEIKLFDPKVTGDTTELSADVDHGGLTFDKSGPKLVKVQKDVRTYPAKTDINMLDIRKSASEKHLQLFQHETSTNPSEHAEDSESSSAEVGQNLHSKSKVFTNPGPLQRVSITEKYLVLLSTERPSSEPTVHTEKSIILPSDIYPVLGVNPVASESVSNSPKEFVSAEVSADSRDSTIIDGEVTPENLDYINKKDLYVLSAGRSIKPEVDTAYTTNTSECMEQELKVRTVQTQPPKADPSTATPESQTELLSTEPNTRTPSNRKYVKIFTTQFEEEMGSRSVLPEITEPVPSNTRLDFVSTERSTTSALYADGTAVVPAESENDFQTEEFLTETSVVDPTKFLRAEQLPLLTSDPGNSSAHKVGYPEKYLATTLQELSTEPTRFEEPKPNATNLTTEREFQMVSREPTDKPSVEADLITYNLHDGKEESEMKSVSTEANNALSARIATQNDFQYLPSEQNIRLSEYAMSINNVPSLKENEAAFTAILNETPNSAPPKYATEKQIGLLPSEPSAEIKLNAEHNKNIAAELQQVLENKTLLAETDTPFVSKWKSEEPLGILPTQTSGKAGAEMHQELKMKPLLTVTHIQMPWEFMTEERLETSSNRSRTPSELESERAEGNSAELTERLSVEPIVTGTESSLPTRSENYELHKYSVPKQSTKTTENGEDINYILSELPQRPEIKSVPSEIGKAIVPKFVTQERIEMLSNELSGDMRVNPKYIGGISTEKRLQGQDSEVKPLQPETSKPVQQNSVSKEELVFSSTETRSAHEMEVQPTLEPLMLESASDKQFQSLPEEPDSKSQVNVEFTRYISPQVEQLATTPLSPDVPQAHQLKHTTNKYIELTPTEPLTIAATDSKYLGDQQDLSIKSTESGNFTRVTPDWEAENKPEILRSEPMVDVEYTRNTSAELLPEIGLKPVLRDPHQTQSSKYVTDKQTVVLLNETLDEDYTRPESEKSSESKPILSGISTPMPSEILRAEQIEQLSAGPRPELRSSAGYNRKDANDTSVYPGSYTKPSLADKPRTGQSISETKILLQGLPLETSIKTKLESDHNTYAETNAHPEFEIKEWQQDIGNQVTQKSVSKEQIYVTSDRPVITVTLNASYKTNISPEIRQELNSDTVLVETANQLPSKPEFEKGVEFSSTHPSTDTAVESRSTENLSPKMELEIEIEPALTSTSEAVSTIPSTAVEVELSNGPDIEIELQTENVKDILTYDQNELGTKQLLTEEREPVALKSTIGKQTEMFPTEPGAYSTIATIYIEEISSKTQQQLGNEPILAEKPVPVLLGAATKELLQLSSKSLGDIGHFQNGFTKITKGTGVEQTVENIPDGVSTESSEEKQPDLLSEGSDTNPAAGFTKNVLANTQKEQELEPLLTEKDMTVSLSTRKHHVQSSSAEPSENPTTAVQHMNFSPEIHSELDTGPLRIETFEPFPRNTTTEVVLDLMQKESRDNPSENAEYFKNITAEIGTEPLFAERPNVVTAVPVSPRQLEIISDVSLNKHALEAEITSSNKSGSLSSVSVENLKLEADNNAENEEKMLVVELSTRPTHQSSSSPEARYYEPSGVTSPSTPSPERLAEVQSRPLEINYPQKGDNGQKDLHPTVSSSYPLHGNGGAHRHEPEVEGGFHLSVTEAMRHALHINKDEYGNSAPVQHSGEGYGDKESGLLSQGVRRSSESFEHVASRGRHLHFYRPITVVESQVSQKYADLSVPHPDRSVAHRTPHTLSADTLYSGVHKQEPEVLPAALEKHSLPLDEISSNQAVGESPSGMLTQPHHLTRNYILTETLILPPYYPEGLTNDFKPHSSKTEIQELLPFRQEPNINDSQERRIPKDMKTIFVRHRGAPNSDKDVPYTLDNQTVREYKEYLHSSQLQPKILEETVKLNATKIPDETLEMKEHVSDYHTISLFPHHEAPSQVLIKRPPNIQSVVLPIRESRLERNHMAVQEISEISSPRMSAQIASHGGSQGDILENNIQSKEAVSNLLSHKASGFFTRFRMPSLSEAHDELRSSNNIDGTNVLRANQEDTGISKSGVDSSENLKTTENTSLYNKQQKMQTSKNQNIYRIIRYSNHTSDNSVDNVMKKLVRYGKTKVSELARGLGSIFGLDSVNVAGEISVPDKSPLRDSPGD
jgi:hypothetical protein